MTTQGVLCGVDTWGEGQGARGRGRGAYVRNCDAYGMREKGHHPPYHPVSFFGAPCALVRHTRRGKSPYGAVQRTATWGVHAFSYLVSITVRLIGEAQGAEEAAVGSSRLMFRLLVPLQHQLHQGKRACG